MSSAWGDTTGSTGGNALLENRQPTLGIQYIICIDGIFPNTGPEGNPTGSTPPDRTDPIIAEIKPIAFGTPVPAGWALCQGQVLPIPQFQALFSIIGSAYGGDGQSTFALPDLRGGVPIGAGQGVGFPNYALGQANYNLPGLTVANLPSHTHTYQGGGTTGATGNGAAFDNRQSFLAFNFLIAADGEIMIWPSGSIPIGWTRCDGRLLSVSSASYLYSFIGNTYGGNATNFALPDTRGRILLGDDASVWPLGFQYGTNDVFLGVSNLPAHTHTTPSGATGPTGGGTSANNYQPSLVMRWMVSAFGSIPNHTFGTTFPMVGEIRLIAGASSGGLPAAQWLLLNGDLFSNAAYPDLRNVIGTSFGGGGTTFAVPDLRGFAGAGSGAYPGSFNQPLPFAGTVGSPNLSISIAQMAAHTHSFFPFNTLTVTKTADTNDGVCDAADCSLREALTVAAGDGVQDNIIFNIPASSAGCVGTDCTITLSSTLTPAADGGRPTTINGYTGPNTITLSGNNAIQILRLGGGANLIATNLNFTGGNGSAVELDNGGTLTLTNCALFGNTAANGGAFFTNTGSVLNMTNVTISGNTTSAFGSGGGIWNAGGAITAINCTIASNTARNDGGVVTFNGGTFTTRNTILAANTAVINPDAFGSFTSLGHNIIGNTTGNSGFTGSGDQAGVNPQLAALANNGGPTLTQALQSNSPAINAGDTNPPTYDQRYLLRNGASDIGAYEFSGLSASLKITSLTQLASGQISLQGLGVANALHTVRMSADLTTGFSYLATTTSDATGAVQFDDAGAIGATKRFYRLTFP